jgi:hypothetical protein
MHVLHLRRIFVMHLCFTLYSRGTIFNNNTFFFTCVLLVSCFRQEVLCDPVHWVSEVVGTSQDWIGGVRRGGRWGNMQLVMSGGSRTCTASDNGTAVLNPYRNSTLSAAQRSHSTIHIPSCHGWEVPFCWPEVSTIQVSSPSSFPSALSSYCCYSPHLSFPLPCYFFPFPFTHCYCCYSPSQLQNVAEKQVITKTAFPAVCWDGGNLSTHTVFTITAFSNMEQWTGAQHAFAIKAYWVFIAACFSAAPFNIFSSLSHHFSSFPLFLFFSFSCFSS